MTPLFRFRQDQARHAAEEAEHAHMRADPVRQGLGPARLGVGIAGSAEHADEDLRLASLSRVRVVDRQLLAGVVHEDLVAGHVLLAHGGRQPPLEAAEQVAEAAVAIAARLDRPVLLPEQHQGDARSLQLHSELGPVRLLTTPRPGVHARPREEILL